jgi:hypothetical protein
VEQEIRAIETVNQIPVKLSPARCAAGAYGRDKLRKAGHLHFGNPAGFRLLAEILQAQADSVGSGGGESRYFFKLERDSGSLFFATDDSVEVFEIHCEDHFPEKHETSAYRRKD